MRIVHNILVLLAKLVFLSMVVPAHAAIIPIDLNDFFADPTVSVAVDGSSATMAENPFISPVLLANDPGLGDPNVIVPGVGTSLAFDFDFLEGVGDDDIFLAFVLDAATGLSLGTGFEFLASSSGMGSVSFDLSSLVGLTLGLQYELGANPGDLGLTSTAVVSNVRLEQVMAAPEPNILVLIATSILFVMGMRRRRFAHRGR
jgi:hypothetical protein